MAIELKAKKKHYNGRNDILFPFVGKQSVSSDGILLIEDDAVAHSFVKSFPDFGYANPKKDDPNYVEGQEEVETVNKKEKPAPKVEELQYIGDDDDFDPKQLDDPNMVAPKNERVEFLASIPGMNVKQLKELCAPFPEDEWKDKKKDQLVEYLITKL